jgi:hypothetical protein
MKVTQKSMERSCHYMNCCMKTVRRLFTHTSNFVYSLRTRTQHTLCRQLHDRKFLCRLVFHSLTCNAMLYTIYEKYFTLKGCQYMFRPMWSSSGVNITGRGNCCLLLLLMLLIYKSPRGACVFEMVGCILCVVLRDLFWSIRQDTQHIIQQERIQPMN